MKLDWHFFTYTKSLSYWMEKVVPELEPFDGYYAEPIYNDNIDNPQKVGDRHIDSWAVVNISKKKADEICKRLGICYRAWKCDEDIGDTDLIYELVWPEDEDLMEQAIEEEREFYKKHNIPY